jgi:phage protein D
MDGMVKPTVLLNVNHRDVTGDFSAWLLDLVYTDHVAGESDGLEIRLDNADGPWLGSWYPVKGSTVEAWLGYEGSPLLYTGECRVDEIEVTGAPDQVSIRALGASNMTDLRTRKSKAFENQSLRALANQVAATHGLQLIGEVPDLTWRRATQHRETDLAFLCRLGREYNLVFSVKGGQLVFHDEQTLEGLPPALRVQRGDLSSFRFREKMTVASANASYFDPASKTLLAADQTEPNPGPDQVKTQRRTESRSHAQRLAKSSLHQTKGWEREGTLTLAGDTRLVAGSNLDLAGFGALDGLWQIRSAQHSLARNKGYVAELEVRYVAS